MSGDKKRGYKNIAKDELSKRRREMEELQTSSLYDDEEVGKNNINEDIGVKISEVNEIEIETVDESTSSETSVISNVRIQQLIDRINEEKKAEDKTRSVYSIIILITVFLTVVTLVLLGMNAVTCIPVATALYTILTCTMNYIMSEDKLTKEVSKDNII